jgi:hypothetical protein
MSDVYVLLPVYQGLTGLLSAKSSPVKCQQGIVLPC